MDLGRLGVWYPVDRLDADQLRAFIGTVEAHGYGTFWYPEAQGYESLSLGGFLLANTTRLQIGSSITNIYGRDAFTAQRGLATLRKLYGDRFILGLGVSHIPLVEGLRGHRYEKPLAAMRSYLDGIGQPDAGTWPIVVAALGPKMLALAGERSSGAISYNVTPEHTAQAAAIIGPGKWLAVEQKVCIGADPAVTRALARKELAIYMTLPNYRNNWLRLGFSEAELADGGSDRFLDAMVLQGDADTIKGGLRAHFAAGATHVCIQPVHAAGDWAARDATLAALADT